MFLTDEQKTKDRDGDKMDHERTMDLIKEVGNSVVEGIKLTSDLLQHLC